MCISPTFLNCLEVGNDVLWGSFPSYRLGSYITACKKEKARTQSECRTSANFTRVVFLYGRTTRSFLGNPFASFRSWLLWLLLACNTVSSNAAAPLDALSTLWTSRSEPWSHLAYMGRTRTAQTKLEFSHRLLIRSRSRESSTWGLSGRQDMPLSRGVLRLEFRHANTAARLSSGEVRLSTRQHNPKLFDLSYGLPFNYLDMGFKARLRPSAMALEGAVGLCVKFPANWNAAAHFSRYAVDQQIALDFKSDRVDADILGYRSASGFTLQGGVFDKIAVDLHGDWGDLSAGSREKGYALAPQADWGAYEGVATFSITPALSLHTRGRYRQFSGQPEGYLQDRRFMRSHAEAHDVAGFLSLRYAPQRDQEMAWGIFANRGEIQVRRGRLESWPFINSFASVLGGKEWSFWGDADLRLYGTDFRLRRRRTHWQLETGSHLFYLHGNLSTTSRERRKFSFVSLLFPEEHRAAGTFGATVLDFDVQIEYQFSAWSLRYSVAQIIPLYMRSAVAVAAKSTENKRGGRQQHLSLTYTPDLK